MDGENNGKPIKMDDLGVKPTIFGNAHIENMCISQILDPWDPGSPKLRMVSWKFPISLPMRCFKDTPIAHPLRFGDWIPRVMYDYPPGN